MKQRWLVVLTAAFVGFFSAGPAEAGPIIIDGTDIEDGGHHGISPLAGGGIYIRESFTNMGPQVTNGVNAVVVLGVDPRSVPGQLITAAFNASALPGAGWNLRFIDSTTNISDYFANNAVGTGIMYIPGDDFHTSSGITAAEQAVLNANAKIISSHVAAGGGLIAHAQGNTGGWGWLQTLIPGIVVNDAFAENDLAPTADGKVAFPALTNQVLDGSDPWHQHFTGNFGGLVPLIRADRLGNGDVNPNGRVVAIGGGAGTTFEGVVPEPTTAVILGLGLVGVAGYRKLRRNRLAA